MPHETCRPFAWAALALISLTGGTSTAHAIAFGEVTVAQPTIARIATGPQDAPTTLATATFISPRWMLTAAHVIVDLPMSAFVQSSFGDFAIAETRIHPLFDPLDLTLGYDIGLIRVVDALPDGIAYPAMALQSPGDLIDLETFFIGFGLDEGGADTGEKRQATAAIQFDFPEAFGFYSDIAGPGAYLRPGDSGGPAFASIGGVDSIIGVASYTILFGNLVASGFSPLAPAGRFIEAALAEEVAAISEPVGLALVGAAALVWLRRGRGMRHRA